MIRYRSLFCHCAVAFGLWFCFIEPSVAVDATNLKSPFTLEVGVIDRESGSAVEDALVLGREYATGPVEYSHSGGHVSLECIRTAFGRTQADGRSQLSFPPTDQKTASVITNTERRVGLLVYKAGYCSPSAARHQAAQFTYGPYEHQPSAPNHVSGAPVAYEPARLALDRSNDTGEYRLLYLTQLVSSSGCSYGSGQTGAANGARMSQVALPGFKRDSAAGIAGSPPVALSEPERSITQAVLAEAERNVRTDYDRFLQATLRRLADPGAALPAAPETTINTMSTIVVDAIARREASCQISKGMMTLGWHRGSAVARRPSQPPPVDAPALLCRCGEPDAKCDINQRDKDGRTLLMKALWNPSQKPWPPPQVVKLLLESGINPNIETYPGGETALDMILADVAYGEKLQYNIAVLEVLASNPAVTIRREDREQLDRPEAQWTVIDPARVAYYRKLRDLTKALPLRTAFKSSCPMLPTVSANRLQLVRPIPVEQRKP